MDNEVNKKEELKMTRHEIYKRIWKLLDEASSNVINRKQIELEIRSLYKLLEEGNQ